MILALNNIKYFQNKLIYLMQLPIKIQILNYLNKLHMGKKRLSDYLKKVALFNKFILIKLKTLH